MYGVQSGTWTFFPLEVLCFFPVSIISPVPIVVGLVTLGADRLLFSAEAEEIVEHRECGLI